MILERTRGRKRTSEQYKSNKKKKIWRYLEGRWKSIRWKNKKASIFKGEIYMTLEQCFCVPESPGDFDKKQILIQCVGSGAQGCLLNKFPYLLVVAGLWLTLLVASF